MIRSLLVAIAFVFTTHTPLFAADLVMVERPGCGYCIQWKTEIAPAYPNTEMGQFAPLKIIDISTVANAEFTLARGVNFTPTFLLVENGAEIGRIEGYPGQDFFWGVLEMLLRAKLDYTGAG